jgi:hypothetical protein
MTSFNQATLDALKAEATTTYKNRIDGYDAYATTCPKTLRGIGGWVTGAEVAVVVVGPYEIIPTFIEYTEKGYTYNKEAGTIPLARGGSQQIHLFKPEEPKDEEYECEDEDGNKVKKTVYIEDEDGNKVTKKVRIEGVPYQCDDLKKIHAEVEAKYRADCEANDAAATKSEEARIYAEALAEVEAEEAAALTDKAAARAAQIQARIAEKVTAKPATKRATK